MTSLPRTSHFEGSSFFSGNALILKYHDRCPPAYVAQYQAIPITSCMNISERTSPSADGRNCKIVYLSCICRPAPDGKTWKPARSKAARARGICQPCVIRIITLIFCCARMSALKAAFCAVFFASGSIHFAVVENSFNALCMSSASELSSWSGLPPVTNIGRPVLS